MKSYKQIQIPHLLLQNRPLYFRDNDILGMWQNLNWITTRLGEQFYTFCKLMLFLLLQRIIMLETESCLLYEQQKAITHSVVREDKFPIEYGNSLVRLFPDASLHHYNELRQTKIHLVYLWDLPLPWTEITHKLTNPPSCWKTSGIGPVKLLSLRELRMLKAKVQWPISK